MYCEQCGTKNPDGAKFCEECGAALSVGEVSVPPQETHQKPETAESLVVPSSGALRTPPQMTTETKGTRSRSFTLYSEPDVPPPASPTRRSFAPFLYILAALAAGAFLLFALSGLSSGLRQAAIPVPTAARAVIVSVATNTPRPTAVPPTTTPHLPQLVSSVVVTVSAREGWQPIGFEVPQNTLLHITVVNGQWTYEKGTAPYNHGEGETALVCASVQDASRCTEPLPKAPKGALIGRAGSQAFVLGNVATIFVKETGVLFLRINDDDRGLWDNDGTLSVEIRVES